MKLQFSLASLLVIDCYRKMVTGEKIAILCFRGLATEQWNMLKRAIIGFFIFSCFAARASAQGIYTTAFAITPNSSFGGLDLYDDFEPGAPVFGGGYHIYSIDSSLKLVFQGSTLGGVGARFSIVNEGDVLDPSRFVAPPFSLDGYQLIVGQPFLVGMDLRYIQLTTIPTQERFGWARLEYTASGLQILDQATALGGNGIIAGTTTVLPEPSTLSLIGVGAVGLLFAHRRLKSRRENGPPVGQ